MFKAVKATGHPQSLLVCGLVLSGTCPGKGAGTRHPPARRLWMDPYFLDNTSVHISLSNEHQHPFCRTPHGNPRQRAGRTSAQSSMFGSLVVTTPLIFYYQLISCLASQPHLKTSPLRNYRYPQAQGATRWPNRENARTALS